MGQKTSTVALKDHSLNGPFSVDDLGKLAEQGPYHALSLRGHPLLTLKFTQALAKLKVQWLHLWCDVTRAALRPIFSMEGLEILDVFYLRSPGRLQGIMAARHLKQFRANWLNAEDLLEISQSNSLNTLGAQNATLSIPAIAALSNMPSLKELDLEESDLTDDMAALLATSQSLQTLDVGSTALTGKGLKQICQMKQLRRLDIWNLNICAQDLEWLANLPHLTYLSLGSPDGQQTLDASSVLPRLAELPALKELWLDGIELTEAQIKDLQNRYSKLRLD